MQQPKDIQLTPQIKSILENITKKNGGLLPTSAVVKAAEDEKSPLHKYFTWSDEDADLLPRRSAEVGQLCGFSECYVRRQLYL